jgi:hypothetical protein
VEQVPAQGIDPRLLIADDHALFAEALRIYLERTYPILAVVHDGPVAGFRYDGFREGGGMEWGAGAYAAAPERIAWSTFSKYSCGMLWM